MQMKNRKIFFIILPNFFDSASQDKLSYFWRTVDVESSAFVECKTFTFVVVYNEVSQLDFLE